MGYRRRYRRRSNGFGSMVGDAAATANGFGPKGALIVGVLGFAFFYLVFPWLLEAHITRSKTNASAQMGQLLETIIGRRWVRPSELAGIAILVFCTGLAVWKALTQRDLDSEQRRSGTFFARLLARFLD